jgi:ribosomal-protein-alanine N-acetyltransferase
VSIRPADSDRAAAVSIRPADSDRAAAVSILETPRLVLRPFAPADAPGHLRLYSRPEVTRFLAGGPFLGEAAAQRSRAALEVFMKHWTEHGFGVWAVVDRATGALIGQCGLKYLPDRPEVEILYALEQAYWGRGVATEAAAAALRYGFESARLERIVAVAFPENRASHRVMEKIGLTYEGMVEVYGGIRAVYYAISRDAFFSRSTRVPSAGGKA